MILIIACSSGERKDQGIQVSPEQEAEPVSTDIVSNGETTSTEESTSGNAVLVTVEEGMLFSGIFSVNVSGYMGTLTLEVSDGQVRGRIRFPEWGRGTSHELKDVSVNIRERKIYFVRSVATEEERIRTGSSRLFTQSFYGQFSPDWKKIKGVYREAGAENSWQAER